MQLMKVKVKGKVKVMQKIIRKKIKNNKMLDNRNKLEMIKNKTIIKNSSSNKGK